MEFKGGRQSRYTTQGSPPHVAADHNNISRGISIRDRQISGKTPQHIILWKKTILILGNRNFHQTITQSLLDIPAVAQEDDDFYDSAGWQALSRARKRSCPAAARWNQERKSVYLWIYLPKVIMQLSRILFRAGIKCSRNPGIFGHVSSRPQISEGLYPLFWQPIETPGKWQPSAR